MSVLRPFLLLALSLGSAVALYAQPDPIKWGDIPEEHLRMQTFPEDTQAVAVVLADYGTVWFDRDYSYTFERHRRIKILSEAAYDAWGSFTIPYLGEDGLQRVSGVRGQTFVLDAEGKVRRQKLEKKSIFYEDIDGSWKRVRFTLPALAPGAVIEYRYTLRSTSPLFLPEWAFQTSEPTLWSEYRPEIPARLAYVQVTHGVLSFAVQEAQDAIRPSGESKLYRLAMRDVPALREEPYMTTPNDHRARIQYQLSSYYVPNHGVEKVLQSWEELAKELMGLHSFGQQLDRPRRAVRQQVEALTAGLQDPLEKMRALYDYVRTTVVWNEEIGFLLDQDLDDVLKKQRGSSPEIALLLVSMLREAGLEAHPVLISTRSHGRIIDVYPVLSQFNDVLAHVRIGGQDYLLDATDPLRPYDLLPYEALNGRGWLVRKQGAEWIPIEAGGKYMHRAVVTAALAADGTLTGTFQGSDDQYSALFKRHRLQEVAPEAFIRETLLEDLGDVRLDSHRVEHDREIGEALRTEAAFSATGYAQAAGDFLYLNPFLVGRLEENPLRLTERTFPVDMAYPRDLTYFFQLKLPPGYSVLEVPPGLRASIASGGGLFLRSVEQQGDVLNVQMRLVLARSIFEPRQYQDLRAFYDRVVAAQAEQVVLKRAPEPEPAAGGETSGGEK